MIDLDNPDKKELFDEDFDPLGGEDSPWHDDGKTILIDLGSMGNEVDVHAENRKMNASSDPVEEDRLFYERKGLTPPDPVEDIKLDTSNRINPLDRYEGKNYAEKFRNLLHDILK